MMSGNFESERTPMTRTGNQYLRYYMVEAANSVQLREATPNMKKSIALLNTTLLIIFEITPTPLSKFYHLNNTVVKKFFLHIVYIIGENNVPL